MFCSLIKRIDLYGKQPEFYFKGNPSKTTWVGRILTYLYVIIYIAFLVYKLNRMIKRVDVTFYDTYAYTGEIPSIQLNKEIFYGAFAFDIPGTEIPYADESIYHINAKYVSQVKVDGQWIVNETKIPFKHCELSDFGSKYQSIVGNRDLSGMYCPTNVDFVLEGYTTLDRYSYLKLNFAPCRETPGSDVQCADTDTLLKMLYATTIDSIIEDIELTPRDHDHPIQYLERDVPGPTYLELYQMIYVYMQLVIIETDDNIIGFEALSNTKVTKHLKYDTSWIISRPILQGKTIFYPPDDPAEDLNDITIQLSPNVLTQKRTYVQLIDVLGDVGGLMELINMVFSVVVSFIVNILYEKSLVNNIFSFDLDKKRIILKKIKSQKKNNFQRYNEEERSQNEGNKNKLNLNEVQNIDEKNMNEDANSKNSIMNKENNARKNQWKYNMKKEGTSQTNVEIYQSKNKSSKRNLYDIQDEQNKGINDMNAVAEKQEEKISYQEQSINEPREQDNIGKNVIHKINLNKFYIHCGFCCVRSVNNVNNALLDEGIRLVTEQLDILNIFRKLFIESRKGKNLKEKLILEEMSDECKKKIDLRLLEMNDVSNSSVSE